MSLHCVLTNYRCMRVDVIDVGLSDHRLLRWTMPLVFTSSDCSVSIRRASLEIKLILSDPAGYSYRKSVLSQRSLTEARPYTAITYRAHFSTDTAVLKVLADNLRAVDGGDLVLLTLLDLSAAFIRSTTRRFYVASRLYGIGDTVRNWYASYL